MGSNKKTVLVVDDNHSILLVLREILEEQGYRVLMAQSASDAIDQIQTGSVDIVISDIQMPKMSGTDLLKQLHEKASHIPVFLMTGGFKMSKEEAQYLGAENLFSKPFDKSDIIEALKPFSEVL